ncbi:hypothetical protein D3C75_1385660 [compost metagenome]
MITHQTAGEGIRTVGGNHCGGEAVSDLACIFADETAQRRIFAAGSDGIASKICLCV